MVCFLLGENIRVWGISLLVKKISHLPGWWCGTKNRSMVLVSWIQSNKLLLREMLRTISRGSIGVLATRYRTCIKIHSLLRFLIPHYMNTTHHEIYLTPVLLSRNTLRDPAIRFISPWKSYLRSKMTNVQQDASLFTRYVCWSDCCAGGNE